MGILAQKSSQTPGEIGTSTFRQACGEPTSRIGRIPSRGCYSPVASIGSRIQQEERIEDNNDTSTTPPQPPA